MSADKLTESDSLPDQGADVTDKPFPGASADREPASAPEPSPSMDQMRAAYANAGSASDIEASAKADEAAAARGSDTGTAEPEVSEPGVSATEVSEPAAEGPGVVPGTVVHDGEAEGPSAHSDGSALAGEVRQPEGTTGPERTDIPAFPGAPPDREAAPAPEPAPSMDQMREAFARSSNSDELRAAAKADEAAAKEAPAEKGTAAAKPGGDSGAGRDAVASREPVAGESGEQQQGEEDGSGSAEETAPEQPVVLRAPQQEMPAAEAPEGEPAPLDGGRADTAMVNQPDARHEDVVVLDQGEDTEAAEPTAEGMEPANEGVVATRSDVTTPEADDKPVVAGVVEPERPEAAVPPEEGDTGDTSASRSEVRLDTRSDDQRPVTRAEMMAMIAEMKAEAKAEAKAEIAAEYDAKFEAIDAKHETEKAELKQKVSELEAKLEAAPSDKRLESDRLSNDGEQPEPPGGHDVVGRGERSEAPGPSDETEMADRAVVRQRGDVGELRDENLAEEASDRPDLESAGKDALSLAGAFSIVPSPLSLMLAGDSARRSFEKMSPEDQYSTITALDTLSNAFSSLSPGTAVVAATTSIYGPAVGAKARHILHKIMRKD